MRRRAASSGTNGCGDTARLSAVRRSGMENGTARAPAPSGTKVVLRRRSAESVSRSISVTSRPGSGANGACSARMSPFSAMRWCAEKTARALDSSGPALA